MSLTITATFLPSRLFNILLKTVVLPAPKNPDNTVTGSLLETLVFIMKLQKNCYLLKIAYVSIPEVNLQNPFLKYL